MKLWNKIRMKMLAHPEQTVSEGDACLTFRELCRYTEDKTGMLTGLRSCAILCRSEMESSKAVLVCLAAGVTAVPLSARYGKTHCDKILDTICPDAVISDETGALSVHRLPGGAYTEPKTHPALIMCTSGTTGNPKGVMLTEKNLYTNIRDISDYFLIGTSDTILISRPLYHCAVLTGEFLTALWKGTNIHFTSEAFDPPAISGLIRRHRITVFCGTPTLLGFTARFMRTESLSSPLKHICVSGECMDRRTALYLAETFPSARIYHVYGLTEAAPRVSVLPPSLFLEAPESVGLPLRSVKLRILCDNGKSAKPCEEGILYVKGGNVMSGYYNDPENTAAVLQNGWLRTGDIAVFDQKGRLRIQGRQDGMIIKAGMNIYPQEIENALKSDSRVKEVMAYGLKTGSGTQIGLKLSGDFHTPEEVRMLCCSLLPGYQIPVKIEILPELHKTASGKLARRE